MKENVIVRFTRLCIAGIVLSHFSSIPAQEAHPFGPGERGNVDTAATGEWWKPREGASNADRAANMRLEFLDVPRDEVVAFALYTHDHGVLKITAQLYPLKPGESREVRLEFQREGRWQEIAREPVIDPGWSANFRVENWDSRLDVPYRVRHGENAVFEGLIRKDPIEKEEIVVASLSCNSNQDRGMRENIVRNIQIQNPDLLFFAGDQSYDHREHTFAWLLWGKQFRDIIKDRPVITIPDDHDIGQGNLWGEGGIVADSSAGDSGGYFYSPEYVKMVERCQTWHLPDPFDPTPIAQGIGVYYTRLRVGGIDFAIVEDRKFKSGPKGKIPRMGPRPDHINREFDPKDIDLPGLTLLGERQLRFLHEWGQDWTGAEMKAVLSQTAFCGAVHLHGSKDNRLLADLDSNAWPQTGRNKALREIRRALACHLAGDQHLATVVKHGIDDWRDGPFAFVTPAIVNTIYGRWWWPKDEKPGGNPVPNSPLPWTGDYKDGLGNKITMIAYANPKSGSMAQLRESANQEGRGDGYGLIRFNKKTRRITFECWPRFSDVNDGDKAQYPGWPFTFDMMENDGRQPAGYLPELHFDVPNPVVQVVQESTREILYTLRIRGESYRPPVYAEGVYTIKAGRNKPDEKTISGIIVEKANANSIGVLNIAL